MTDEPEFTDHYEIMEQPDGSTIFNTYSEARKAAGGDPHRVWFIREGDDEFFWTKECGEDASVLETATDDFIDDWYGMMLEKHGPAPFTVEPYHGQFVNCLGFYVTTEPRKPEHRDNHITFKH